MFGDSAKLRPDTVGWYATSHDVSLSHPGFLPFATYGVLPVGVSANETIFMASVPRALTVKAWAQSVRVNTTNDTSNYWTIELVRRLTGGVTNVVLAQVETSKFTAGTWTLRSLTVNGAVLATDVFLFVRVVKTGSPGTIDLAGPGVYII